MNISNILNQLQTVYPEHINHSSQEEIIWKDGTHMPLDDALKSDNKLDYPSLRDQLTQAQYPAGNLSDKTLHHLSQDPGRIRHQPFFSKMYGDSRQAVEANLTSILWMPEAFSNKYPIKVTTINGIDKKLQRIGSELAKLPTTCHKFLSDPLEAFVWREIAGTQRLSAHSLGIAIDINVEYSHYWQWDLEAEGKPVYEGAPLEYRNKIPWEIILIFEKYGFIWGGKWRHYDTMHFEYRPEMIINHTH